MSDERDQQFTIDWIDRGLEPRVPPNPSYPTGIDIDLTNGREPQCVTALPYPAKRIGLYMIVCHLCGLRVGVTTAGRPDDPRSVRLVCKSMGAA